MREAMGSPDAFRGRLLLYMFFDAHTHLEASAGLAANAATTTMVDWLTAMQIAAKPFLASFSFGDLCCSGTSFLGQLDKQDSPASHSEASSDSRFKTSRGCGTAFQC